MKRTFRLRLSGAHGATVARRLVERALRIWRLDDQLDDALIVTTELVENVSKHTKNGGELHLSVRPGALLIEVADTCTRLPRIQAVDLRSAHGRGMRMVQAIAARWGTQPTAFGKVVWAEIGTAA